MSFVRWKLVQYRSLLLNQFIRKQHVYIDSSSSVDIPLDEIVQRRASLVNLIRRYIKTQETSSTKFSICIPSSTRVFMGPDVVYFPFKQQSDFFYLTGCLQPDAVLVLDGDERTFSTNLFLSSHPMSTLDEYERWFGPTVTLKEKICQMFALDRVYSIEKLSSFELSSSAVLFYNQTFTDEMHIKLSILNEHLIPFLKRASTSCGQLSLFLHSLRAIKSPSEQEILREACRMTSDAFIATMKESRKGIDNEHLIKARFQYECAKQGSISMAFNPVVAAGGRSNILHYQANNQLIEKNDLVMLDGGCLFKQYAGDVTRIWPIGGRFSNVQRQLYEILLAVQKDLIQYLKIGEQPMSRQLLTARADEQMVKYLREECILSPKFTDDEAKRTVKILCPTSASHHLGLDVHDCETLSFSEQLQPGNVITIEPGLYIPFDYTHLPPAYRGFATRLEDDVLLTENSCEILSEMCPKEVDDLYRVLDDDSKNGV